VHDYRGKETSKEMCACVLMDRYACFDIDLCCYSSTAI